jgi:uncharacterized protein (TIGR03435 family)
MLRGLLRDSFELVLHQENRTLLTYTLSAAPGGLKAKSAVPDTAEYLVFAPLSASRMRMIGCVSGRTLAERLTRVLGNPVIDSTNSDVVLRVDLEFDPASAECRGYNSRK